jgi:hypothetical protein
MDVQTREVIACHAGGRRRDSAQTLWVKIPPTYGDQATLPTDRYEAFLAPCRRTFRVTQTSSLYKSHAPGGWLSQVAARGHAWAMRSPLGRCRVCAGWHTCAAATVEIPVLSRRVSE